MRGSIPEKDKVMGVTQEKVESRVLWKGDRLDTKGSEEKRDMAEEVS